MRMYVHARKTSTSTDSTAMDYGGCIHIYKAARSAFPYLQMRYPVYSCVLIAHTRLVRALKSISLRIHSKFPSRRRLQTRYIYSHSVGCMLRSSCTRCVLVPLLKVTRTTINVALLVKSPCLNPMPKQVSNLCTDCTPSLKKYNPDFPRSTFRLCSVPQ